MNTFEPGQVIESAKLNENFDRAMAGGYEYRRGAPGGTTDTTGSSFTDIITFSSLNIPSWATKAVFHWAGTGYTVSAVTDGVVQLLLGSGDNTPDERTNYNSYPINTMWTFASINEVSLSATGSQTLKLQARESAGTGAIRFTSASVWTVKVEYY